MFTAVFLLIYGLLTLLVGLSAFWQVNLGTGLIWVLIWETLLFTTAYDFSRILIAFFYPQKPVPSRPSLSHFPPVAVLYLTRDDFIQPFALRHCQQTYPNTRVFILDDSETQSWQAAIDDTDLAVVRRPDRHCRKAGNLNHWLETYGADYDYIVVVDNDILIPSDFVERMVCHAEHADHVQIAIFQSKIYYWNRADRFADLLNVGWKMEHFLVERVDNGYAMTFPVTAFLARTDALRSIGGFACSITEDHATGVALIEQGYTCKLVDVVSYQSTSTNVRAYTRRMVRWSRGKLGIILKDINRAPYSTAITLLNTQLYFLFGSVLRVLGLLWVTIYLLHYQHTDPAIFFRQVYVDELWRYPILFLSLLLYGFYTVYSLVFRPLVAWKIGTPLLKYYYALLLHIGVGLYAAVPIIRGQWLTLRGRDADFGPTDVEHIPPLPLWRIMADMWIVSVLFVILLVSYLASPWSFLLHAPWFVPALLGLWVLAHAQGTRHPYKPRDLLPDTSDPELSPWLDGSLHTFF